MFTKSACANQTGIYFAKYLDSTMVTNQTTTCNFFGHALVGLVVAQTKHIHCPL
jgi:hypothetical protein